MTGARERLGKKNSGGEVEGERFHQRASGDKNVCAGEDGCVSARWENRGATSFVRRDRGREAAEEGGNQPGGRLRKAVLAQRRALRSRWALI